MEEEKVYDTKSCNYVSMPKEMKEFLDEIEAVCEKHGFSISHEDGQGNFIVDSYKDYLMDWLKRANKGY